MTNATDIENKATCILNQELTAWESAACFVTDKISFQMRNLIKRLRKNYWGVFDSPHDDQTGREKTWIPLTESIVSAAQKNIDLDSRDINFRAKKVSAIGLTSIIRNVTKSRLDEISFGEYLDELLLSLCIDGTAVWKTLEVRGENGEKEMDIKLVDLLNFYIDPTARSIAEAPAVIERALLTRDEFMAMDGWQRKDEAVVATNASRNDRTLLVTAPATTDFIEVFERWGKMPKSLLTGDEADADTVIEGHVVCSGRGKGMVCHLVEANDERDDQGRAKRPYEEVWYNRVPGRWYGKGPAESLLMLQSWLNIVANIRINRSYISQLGIFKIKRNSGITPQMLNRLATNGALAVNDMNDVEQMVVQEASQASYADEDRIHSWAERVTSAFETVTGEGMPASTPATNAAIQSRSAQSTFVKVKEGVGLFIERWLRRQALPILLKSLKASDVIRLSGEPDEINDIVDRVVNELVYRRLDEMNKEGIFFDPSTIGQEIERLRSVLTTRGREMFFKMVDKIDYMEFDVAVDVTAESIDKAVLAQNLVSVLQTVAAIPQSGISANDVLRQLFDLMGLDSRQITSKPATMPLNASGTQGVPQMPLSGPGTPPASLQGLVTGANTLQQ